MHIPQQNLLHEIKSLFILPNTDMWLTYVA